MLFISFVIDGSKELTEKLKEGYAVIINNKCLAKKHSL